jgi:hypothetical protein
MEDNFTKDYLNSRKSVRITSYQVYICIIYMNLYIKHYFYRFRYFYMESSIFFWWNGRTTEMEEGSKIFSKECEASPSWHVSMSTKIVDYIFSVGKLLHLKLKIKSFFLSFNYSKLVFLILRLHIKNKEHLL